MDHNGTAIVHGALGLAINDLDRQAQTLGFEGGRETDTASKRKTKPKMGEE